MKHIVLKTGLVAGAVLILEMAITLPLCMRGAIDFDYSALVGYTAMVLAFILIFFGIRSYREEVGGGTISFPRAFQVGILITVIASAGYVLAWEVIYWGFWPDFLDQYSMHMLAKARAAGATAEAIQAMQAEMTHFAELYANPLYNVGLTFLEVFPVGLLVTLVSAAILRRRAPGGGRTATASA
jgi:hypothetical protein